jgi:hypothetical protein
VEFTFLERGGFLVSSAMEHGKIPFVQIRSQLGGRCVVHNPWGGPVTVYRNGAAETPPAQEGDLLTVATEKGDILTLVPAGETPVELHVP